MATRIYSVWKNQLPMIYRKRIPILKWQRSLVITREFPSTKLAKETGLYETHSGGMCGNCSCALMRQLCSTQSLQKANSSSNASFEPVDLTEHQNEAICDETLDSLTEKFQDLEEESFIDLDYNVQYANGVVTVKLGQGLGTYVIKKEMPNNQILLSSPISGEKQYEFMNNNSWVCKEDGKSLHALLTREISKAYRFQVDFMECEYSGKHKRFQMFSKSKVQEIVI